MSDAPDLDGIRFAAATPDWLPRILALLRGMHLPVDDISADAPSGFELALDRTGEVVGMAGLELAGSDALLRSVAVAPDWRGRGLGRELVARREAAAREAGVAAVYLLTTDADGYFRRLGYLDVLRDAVPAAIAAHAQFRRLCPASAKCLAKRL
ncbi:MAG TPA: arsenic resistance N-acetyltransferase ArsN2 [Rhodocyclaceae bacterium]